MMTVLRSVLSWLLAAAFVVLAGLAAVVLGFGNFVIAWQSFTAQGFEQVPLATIPFLGMFAEAVGLGEAPLAALYAAVLTIAMNLAVILCAKLVARTIELAFDYRDLRGSADPVSRDRGRQVRERLFEAGVWLALAIPATFLIVRFDVGQFVLRYEILFRELPDPGEALRWAVDAVERVGAYLEGFIGVAAWGYVGCVVGVALAVEWAFVRAAERWQRLDLAIRQAVEGTAGVAGAVQPSAIDQAVGTGRLADEPAPAALETPGVERPVDTSSGGPTSPSAGAEAVRIPEPVRVPGLVVDIPPTASAPAVPQVDVIVGSGERRRIPLAEIEAQPDQFVRDGAGRTWFLRSYYEQAVLGKGGGKERAA